MYKPSGRNIEHSEKFLQKLNSAIDLITANFKVSEIYMFGSFATGQNKKGSSIDLFILADTNIPFIERLEIINDLMGKNHIRADCLIYTPEELKSKILMKDCFVIDAMQEGIKVYPN